MDLGSVVLAGPVDLVQGGRGLIVRYPVFIEDEAGSRRPWGLVAAVIDADRFYAESGLLSTDLPIQVAISGRDANLADGSVFFGDADIVGREPVMAQVSLPTGGWQLAAIPREGWRETPPNALRFRTLLFLAGLFVVVPITIAGFFHDQLRARTRKLMLQENELRGLSHRLDLALETSRIGVWELNIDTGELSWDRRMKELYGVPPHMTPDAVDHWTAKLHPDDRSQAVEEFDQAVESGETYRSEFRIIPSEGTVRWIRTIGASHTSLSGQRIITGVNWGRVRRIAAQDRTHRGQPRRRNPQPRA
jgi:PAS domain-containing protein